MFVGDIGIFLQIQSDVYQNVLIDFFIYLFLPDSYTAIKFIYRQAQFLSWNPVQCYFLIAWNRAHFPTSLIP